MSAEQSGLEGVVAFATQIAEPDREGGALRYRGVDLEELAGRVPFDDVRGLLVDGSPAAGRRWCSSRGCGNVEKARRHRRRQREMTA